MPGGDGRPARGMWTDGGGTNVGWLIAVVLGVVGAVVLAAVGASFQDIRRYLKMRRM